MKTLLSWTSLIAMVTGLGLAAVAETPSSVEIVRAPDATQLEQLAALEVQRYVYLRTGELAPIVTEFSRADAIVVARKDREPVRPVVQLFETLGEDAYVLKTVTEGGRPLLCLVGGSDVSTLYAAYRFAEVLGVRFYLHGDEYPDEQTPFVMPKLDERHAPLFALRGIQPFHDFPEGPDWWNLQDYKAILAQLPKLRMNFFGLHTYPEDRPAAEPTVWIGKPENVTPDGRVTFAYPAIWYNTALPVGWGFQAMKTADYSCGAAVLFDRDDFGSDVMRGLTPRPERPEECIEIFDRAGDLFHDAFSFARTLGIKTCIGTETPLVTPRRVAETMIANTPGLKPEGGKPAHFSAPIDGTDDDVLYQSVRYDVDAYRCDVPNGVYKVTLHFCEPAYGEAGRRVFGVKIEGLRLIESLDVFAQVGMNRALDYSFDAIRVQDGRLDIEFVRQVEFPCIAAVAVEGEGALHMVNCCGSTHKGYLGEDAMALGPDQIATLYEGIFTRIMRRHPLDYYWFWTPENWTWEEVPAELVERAMTDIRIAYDAAKRVGAPFQLATCGWVLGPQYDRALLGKTLPPDMAVSCINRAVGHDPVEPGFAEVSGRGKWAIPWLEDDPAMTSPQLWVTRMRRDARDALEYGCDGLMGIHWRTRILGPNVAALAQAAWNQRAWREQSEDFYLDWAAVSFGTEVAIEAAAIFSNVDGKLPRPSNWIGGPGGYVPEKRPWAEVEKEYAFVDELAALRSRVVGAANLERFDYWLNTLQFLRATAKMCCRWHEFNLALEKAKGAPDHDAKARIVHEEALPARIALVRAVSVAYEHMLATVSTSGEMGTICNLEQHTFPGMIDAPGKDLAALYGSALPDEAQLPTQYEGNARLVVTTKRTSLETGESLEVRATMLDRVPAAECRLHWRQLGAGEFQSAPMTSLGRHTMGAHIAADQIPAAGIEYYVEASTGTKQTLRWPVTAPTLNQTVVIMPSS